MPREIRGVTPPVVTLFKDTKKQEVNEEEYRAMLKWMADEGVHGVVPTGSIGEFAHMTLEERKRVWDITKDEVGSRILVIPHISSTVLRDAVDMAKYSKDIGADAVMSVSPYYYALSERELETYFCSIAEASELPVVVYNNPFTSKVDLSPEFIAKLANDCPGTKWVIKECSGDISRVARINKLSEGKVRVFAGNDHLGLETFFMCYPDYMPSGWFAGIAHIVPKAASEIYELAERGDFAKARALYYKYHPLAVLLESTPRFPQMIKATMEEAGKFSVGPPRKPALPLSDEERKPIREVLRKIGIL